MSHKAVYYLLSIFVFHFFWAVFFFACFRKRTPSGIPCEIVSVSSQFVRVSECQSVRVSECHYAMMANQRVLTAKSFVMMGRLALVLVIVLSAPLLAWAIPARPYRRAVSAYRAASHDSSRDQNKSAVSGDQV